MDIAAASSAPLIDWSSLGKVAAAAFVFGLAIVVVYSIGILGLSMAAPGDTRPGAAIGHRPVGLALAAVCFAVCLAAVGYGLWIIIPQFHR